MVSMLYCGRSCQSGVMVSMLYCGRSWIRASVRSKSRLLDWYLFPSTKHLTERAKTNWLGIRIMCPNEAIRFKQTCFI